METIKVVVEIDILVSDIVDVLTSAIEGGSNYWYYLPDLSMVQGEGFLVDKIVNTVMSDSSVKVPVNDLEDKETLLGYISKESIINGLKLYFDNEGNFEADNMDASDADIFFQYVVMKEIVFG